MDLALDVSKTLEKLFILVDNHTIYRMSAIVVAICTLTKNRFEDAVRARCHLPGQSHFYDGDDIFTKGLDFNIIMRHICQEANMEPEIDGYLRSFNIYEPIDQQLYILSSLFTYAKCYFSRMSANIGYPARIGWSWIIKIDDLNLRTKAGREEKRKRELKTLEEAILIMSHIKTLVQSDYMNIVVAQDRVQRDELDALIPVGKKNAIEVGPDEYDAILKRLEFGEFYMRDKTAKLKIWKTPSGIRHWTLIENHE